MMVQLPYGVIRSCEASVRPAAGKGINVVDGGLQVAKRAKPVMKAAQSLENAQQVPSCDTVLCTLVNSLGLGCLGSS
jgi:hypothetical protein